LEDIAVHAGHEVLMEVDGNITMTVGNPQGILDEQLRPQPIHLLKYQYFYIYLIAFKTEDLTTVNKQ
jgi:hypothetical protein